MLLEISGVHSGLIRTTRLLVSCIISYDFVGFGLLDLAYAMIYLTKCANFVYLRDVGKSSQYQPTVNIIIFLRKKEQMLVIIFFGVSLLRAILHQRTGNYLIQTKDEMKSCQRPEAT